jgi:hypothetical protein
MGLVQSLLAEQQQKLSFVSVLSMYVEKPIGSNATA